jgi:hypothetical protein
MPNNGAEICFYRRSERRMCTHGAHLRQPMLRSDDSLRRSAKLAVQLFNVGGEETRRKTVDGVADSGPCDESRAQPPPLAPHRQGMNRMCQMKKCIAPNWKFDLEVRLGGMPRYPQMAWGAEWRCSNESSFAAGKT